VRRGAGCGLGPTPRREIGYGLALGARLASGLLPFGALCRGAAAAAANGAARPASALSESPGRAAGGAAAILKLSALFKFTQINTTILPFRIGFSL
jgi:hypothetical protein